MAIVNVDLSEYDMLRTSKAEADKRVEELKKEVEDLKTGRKTVVATKKCIPILDFSRVALLASSDYKRVKYYHDLSSGFNPCIESFEQYVNRYSDKAKKPEIDYVLVDCLESAMRRVYDEAIGANNYSTSTSVEVVGFEEIRTKIEEQLTAEINNELQNRLAKAQEEKENYLTLKAGLEASLKQEYEQMYNQKIKDNETALELLRKEYEELRKRHYELKDESTKYKEYADKYESMRISSNYFEKESLRLADELKDVKHNLEIAKSKLTSKHWYDIFK